MKNFDWLIKTPIAHRGLHDDISPENSISAFKRAIDKGYNIETDVRLTKDLVPVLFHDDDLYRTCKINGKICEYTFDALKNIYLANSKEKIPTLRQLLNLDCTTGLLIELKSDGSGVLEKIVYDELKNYKGNFAVQSFHPFSIKWFKANAPEITRGLLATQNYPPTLNPITRFALKKLLFFKSANPDFLSYDEQFIERASVKRKSLPKLAWTVKSKQREIEILSNSLADNVIFEDYLS